MRFGNCPHALNITEDTSFKGRIPAPRPPIPTLGSAERPYAKRFCNLTGGFGVGLRVKKKSAVDRIACKLAGGSHGGFALKFGVKWFITDLPDADAADEVCRITSICVARMTAAGDCMFEGVENENEGNLVECEENLKHFCKVCKRRFACGRALGGHMRVHGAVGGGEVNGIRGAGVEEEVEKRRLTERNRSSDSIKEEEQEGLNSMYTLRRNPKRSWRFADRDYSFVVADCPDASGSKRFGSTFLRDSRVCDECGREFSSWKALFGHMRCHSDRVWKGHQNKEANEEQEQENSAKNPRENWENSKQNWVTSTENPREKLEVPTKEKLDVSSQHTENPKEKWEFCSEEVATSDSESETENIRRAFEECPDENYSRFHRWMKGKRSKRPRYAHSHVLPNNSEEENEEEDMANCLMMLANGGGIVGATNVDEFQGAAGSSAISGSADNKVPGTEEDDRSELHRSSISRAKTKEFGVDGVEKLASAAPVKDASKRKTKYECKTCRKIFHTYQALGGHRASHKKVKGCFARITVHEETETLEEEIIDEEQLSRADRLLSSEFHKTSSKSQGKDSSNESTEEIAETPHASNKVPKVHECSICHRIFASGQALGGHKRCHAVVSETSSTVTSTKQQQWPQQKPTAREELLDLNLPAPVEDDNGIHDAHSNILGSNVVHSLRTPDAGPGNKISPCYIQPWWIGSNPRQGLLLYKTHTKHLPQEDEADSKLGSKSQLDTAQDIQNRASPWLQV
eukprot:Gb_23552 [translate_table: standard]